MQPLATRAPFTPQATRATVHARRAPAALCVVWSVLTLCAPTPARACSEPVCQNGFLVPEGSARVPANAPGFWWRASRDSGAAAEAAVHVWQVVDDARVELEVMRTFRPAVAVAAHPGAWSAPGVLLGVPLVAGQRLRVEAADTCAIGGYRPFAASVEVTPAQPLPRVLGTLRADPPQHGPLTIAHDGGGCSREANAVYVDVSLSLDAHAAPWADLLLYETRVDGVPYHPAPSDIHGPLPHESWLGRGRDRVVVVCDPSAGDGVGLAAGTHQVQLVARLPGNDAPIASDSIEVSLVCPAEAVVSDADTLYDVMSFQVGAVVVAAQLALLLYIWLTRRRRRGRREA